MRSSIRSPTSSRSRSYRKRGKPHFGRRQSAQHGVTPKYEAIQLPQEWITARNLLNNSTEPISQKKLGQTLEQLNSLSFPLSGLTNKVRVDQI